MSWNHRDLSTPGEPQLEEVSDRVYAYIQPDGSWYINNTGFLVGDSGVTSVHACATERRTLAYPDTIAEVSATSPCGPWSTSIITATTPMGISDSGGHDRRS